MTAQTIRRALAAVVVVATAGWAVPAAAVPPTSAPAVSTTAAADSDTVQVDELELQVEAPHAGSTTGGPTVDPGRDDSVLADRSLPGDRVATEVVETADYQTVGVTWPESEPGADLAVQMRSRTDGTWSEWATMPVSDASPDVGTVDADQAQTRAGTDAVWIGDADAVQLSVLDSAVDVADVRLSAIGSEPTAASGTPSAPPASPEPSGPGTPEPTGPGTPEPSEPGSPEPSAQPALWIDPASAPTTLAASAMAAAPSVITRAQWGAAWPTCTMDTAPLVGAVLHHTAGSNSYSSTAEAMQQIRNDQRYHMQSRGWCDLGYNFVVDKWGNIYEGRSGSLTSSVIGVHAGGFNTGTVGISMLGTYSSTTPSSAVTRSVAQIVGWKLQPYGIDPTGSMVYYTRSGENSRYQNQWVSLPRVFGHRDVAYTACPGDRGQATLPTVRQLARGYAGPMFIAPTPNRWSMSMGDSVTVTAPTISDISWKLTVTDDRTGTVMKVTNGLATEAFGGLVATWDGTGPAGPVGAGPFRLTITGTDAGSGARANSWSGVVQVNGAQNPATVAAVPLSSDLGFVPVTPTRLVDTRATGQALGGGGRMDLTVAGVKGIPADAKAVALNVTAVHASTTTYLRAWPAGAAEPASSVLNADPYATSAVSTVVGVGGERKVSLRNNAGSVHLVVDVTGYYTETGGAGFTALSTADRLLDTRTGASLRPGERRTVPVTRAGVPSGATAVVVNVTAAAAGGNGFVSVVPKGGDVRSTSSVNLRPGTDVANRATVPLSDDAVDVYLEGAQAGVVIDVVGWYGPTGTLHLTPVVPQRVLDTRQTGSPLGPRQTRTVAVRNAITTSSTPAAALATVTATQQTATTTYLTLAAAGQALPPTSDLNTGAGRDQAALALLVWDSSGTSVVYNDQGSTQLVIDVNAVFR